MGLSMPVAMGIWIVLGVVILLIILIGLRHRSTDGAGQITAIDPIPVDPQLLGQPRTGVIDATYVSSTRSGDWLARIGVFGLGHRAKAHLQVFDAGVSVRRDGELDFFLPAVQLKASSRASGMAGKFPGHDGLDVITWQVSNGDTLVDSGFRLTHHGERDVLHDAIAQLITPTITTIEEHS